MPPVPEARRRSQLPEYGRRALPLLRPQPPRLWQQAALRPVGAPPVAPRPGAPGLLRPQALEPLEPPT
eukprot:14435296-Alexandrium_andersonii.AAC.1